MTQLAIYMTLTICCITTCYPTALPIPNLGVTVNLDTGTANNYGGGTDSLAGFENVVGSFFNDTITGDAGDNAFHGLSGDDVIDGGAGI